MGRKRLFLAVTALSSEPLRLSVRLFGGRCSFWAYLQLCFHLGTGFFQIPGARGSTFQILIGCPGSLQTDESPHRCIPESAKTYPTLSFERRRKVAYKFIFAIACWILRIYPKSFGGSCSESNSLQKRFSLDFWSNWLKAFNSKASERS